MAVFFILFLFEVGGHLTKKMTPDKFESCFKVGQSGRFLIIWGDKIYKALFNQWLFDLVLLIIPLLCFFFTMLFIANNCLLDICCSWKENFKEKLALKSMLSLCLNLKLLQLKLKRPVNVLIPTSWCLKDKFK